MIRTATEHALQESKQKLYALIAELEEKVKGGEHAIAALQSSLTRATADRDDAEQSLRSLVQHSPLPHFVADEQGVCESINPALEELVGYGMDELAGKHFSRLFPSEEREFYEEQWKQSADRTEQFRGDTHIVAATGDTISASITFTEIRPDSGTKKYVGSIVDRTVAIDAQRHHAAAVQREQELLDLKSRFIAMVSNQLRTSLVTIAANAELLERFLDKWSDERRYQAFLRINESIRQMVDLVRDVTFTTKASTEEYSLSIVPVDLETLYRETAAELMADLESHHRFVLREQGNVTSLPLDAALMKTVAHQLLSNALKYSRDTTEVTVHIERRDSQCIITVADQGIGIPAAEQQHLFSSFFRASNVSNIFGTGLGLTIVQQCVRLHGGTITVDSQLNKGTTAVVTLPLPS